ncbi:hypothetical protein Gohar_010940 [Gossypium harknessii]|uniref:Uncharacterized protein n=1 Tax=Gossypium harknessii TaxID=34285 RepID=A0A7J9GTV0_9ROSI|nr:hypothetical protein [Gossypium harknessii]
MTADYLHGIEDNAVHRLDKVVNGNEALSALSGSTSSEAEVIRSEDSKTDTWGTERSLEEFPPLAIVTSPTRPRR